MRVGPEPRPIRVGDDGSGLVPVHHLPAAHSLHQAHLSSDASSAEHQPSTSRRTRTSTSQPPPPPQHHSTPHQLLPDPRRRCRPYVLKHRCRRWTLHEHNLLLRARKMFGSKYLTAAFSIRVGMCVFSHTLFDADRWVQVAQYMSAELGYLVRACRVRSRVQKLKNRKSGNDSFRAPPRALPRQHAAPSSTTSSSAHRHHSPSRLPLERHRSLVTPGELGPRLPGDPGWSLTTIQADGAAADEQAPSLSALHIRVTAARQDFGSGSDNTGGYDSVAALQGRLLAKHLDSRPPVRLAAISDDSCDKPTTWNSEQDKKLHQFLEAGGTEGWAGKAATVGANYTAEPRRRRMMPRCVEVPWGN
jgi:hypothetical protein